MSRHAFSSEPWRDLGKRVPPLARYSIGLALAVAAQASRIPLHPQTLMPYITYVPFMLLSAFLGGGGPGLLTTGVCFVEALYFATEPVGHFAVDNPQHWLGLGLLAMTGVTASGLFENLKRAHRAEAAAGEERARLLRRLEIQKSVFESVVQHSPVLITVLRGSDFTYEMVNPAYQALLPDQNLVGRTVADVWPEAVHVIMPPLVAVHNGRKAYHAAGVAVPRRRGKGLPVEECYFDYAYVPLPGDEEDEEVRILVVATEVTEYKRTENAMRAAHHELSTIQGNIPLSLFVIDDSFDDVQRSEHRAGKPDHSNRACPIASIGCLNALEGPGLCGRGVSCGECAVRLAVLDTLRTGIQHNNIEEWLPVSIEGREEIRCLLISVTRMQLENKRVLVCAEDITERKQMETELRSQRDRLQLQADLVNFSHDAIIAMDANRVIKAWNEGAQEIYGWPASEAIGQVTHSFLQTRSSVSTAEIDEQLRNSGRWDGELRHRQKNGCEIIVESRQVVQRSANGSILGILEINRDVTDRNKSQEAFHETLHNLESALKEKTVLLQEVHHRVKNNLAVICSLLNMNTYAKESGEARQALEESQQRVQSIALIHEQLYSSEHFDRINFANYIQQLVQDLKNAFGAADRGIETSVEAESIDISIHRAVPCALILNELMVNAFKHAFSEQQANAKIQITFRQSAPEELELAVGDNGVGARGRLQRTNERSVGSHIVAILAKQLDGSLTQQPGPGTHLVLKFPAGSGHRPPTRSEVVATA